jgi:hypothetical protein
MALVFVLFLFQSLVCYCYAGINRRFIRVSAFFIAEAVCRGVTY